MAKIVWDHVFKLYKLGFFFNFRMSQNLNKLMCIVSLQGDCRMPLPNLFPIESLLLFSSGFRHPPVDGGSTGCCDFSALTRGNERFYSIISNQSLLFFKESL